MTTKLSRLALILVCGAVPACESTTVAPPGSGVLEIGAVVVGTDLDPDGFTVAIDTATPVRIANGNAISQELAPGLHQVSVSDVAANCAVDGAAAFKINVLSGNTTRTTVSLVCAPLVPPPTNLFVYAATAGQADPDGFLVALDNGAPTTVGPFQGAAFQNIAPGAHILTLSGLAPNCVTASPSDTLQIAATQTVQFQFKVTCHYSLPRGLAFTSNRPSGFFNQLFVRSAVGSPETVVSTLRSSNRPVVSPNGTQVVFSQNLTVQTTMWVVNLDGSGIASLTPGSSNLQTPSWSPDGQRISYLDSGDNLWIADNDGSNAASVTPQFYQAGPATWSPDGTKLVTSARNYTSFTFDRVHTLNADGTGWTDLGLSQQAELYPVWSPDGGHIAYLRFPTTGNAAAIELRVVVPDGTGDVAIHTGPISLEQVSWSPDGAQLTFCEQGRIAVVNSDGSNLHYLVSGFGVSCFPQWSPDGSAIAFVTDRDGNGEIYVINIDGTGLRNATLSPAEETMFSWVP